MSWNFDFVIVGAGFSGLTVAEQLATKYEKNCLIVDRRSHIGGNAYDEYDDTGVLIHKYGPHYFRTNSDIVRAYLSKFTDWREARYEIRSWTHGQFWHFPINLNTYEQLVGRPATESEFREYLESKRVAISEPANSEEVIVSQVGWELYEKFFRNYTLKQWQREPKDLDASVCGRIPIRTNRDNRYLNEKFQALPAGGYTRMFQRMVKASPRIKILLNTDYREVIAATQYRHMVFTGPIDQYYDCCYGALPYRSLRFEPESISVEKLKASGKDRFWQPALQVNYPNDFGFTRIVEMKHVTGQSCENTTIVREYPDDYGPGKEPYYPVPARDARAMFEQYALLAAQEKKVTFLGRLANYRYYNMDEVVRLALEKCEELAMRTTHS